MSSRPLRVAHFAVDDEWLFVVDDTFPVVVQLDRRTGSLERTVAWGISSEHRDQRASTALLVHRGALWVSSPIAGGMIRIDIATGRTSKVALDATPGPIVGVGETTWIVADANWKGTDSDAAALAVDAEHRRRRVVWAESSTDPRRPWLEEAGTLSAGSESAPLFDDEHDDFSWDTPRPVWRVVEGEAERVDLGGDVSRLVALPGDDLVAVLRRLEDPVVKTRQGPGAVRYTYPGVLARCAPGETPMIVVQLPDTSGSFFVDREQYWICGYGLEAHLPTAPAPVSVFAADPDALLELDIATGNVTRSTLSIEPEAIVGGVAVAISRTHASPYGGRTVRCEAHCYDLEQPREPTRVGLPRTVETYEHVVVNAGTVWFVADSRNALVWLDPGRGTSGEILLDIDLGPSAPTPIRPVDVDLDHFEAAQLATLRAGLLASWVDERGNESPFIDGITFDSVELRDHFPDSHIVARFRAVDRPGVLFARRWNLYDELGNVQDLEYADVHLAEYIEAAGWGLPRIEECQADDEGVVWF